MYICFFDDFVSNTVKPVVEWILLKRFTAHCKRPAHLTLIINSPGGELPSTFALIDTMRGSVFPFTQ